MIDVNHISIRKIYLFDNMEFIRMTQLAGAHHLITAPPCHSGSLNSE